ncbi:MAG: hypothetical protein NTV51_21005 [Verrucomicrobia bacterium]|nr:hypothetical protein [Verrucomicrobiota bacterium]
MTRNGKIALLPRTVRDALNGRLLDGEPGPGLLAWLNREPAVRAVLAEHFGGRAINPQNLSAWRLGGFADWCRQRDRLEIAERLRGRAEVATPPGESQ